MPPSPLEREGRLFSKIFTRDIRRRAWAWFRNNPPEIKLLNDDSEEDRTKAFLLNKFHQHWWKQLGGHKKMDRYLERMIKEGKI